MSVWSLLVLAALMGHFGIMLASYNRLSATGIKRSRVKRVVKGMLVFTIGLPLLLAWLHFDLWVQIFERTTDAWTFPPTVLGYGYLCLLAWPILGIPWLIFRPIWGLEWISVQREIEVVDVSSVVSEELPLTARCRFESKLPLNQIFELSIETIELPVPGLPDSLDGYRIAHLSDMHLTGHIHQAFSRYVVERSVQWKPDMMVLSGDIIDTPPCIDWLAEIFKDATAPDGCYFVLGNHDTRISDPDEIRSEMERLGWIDLGGIARKVELRGVDTLLMGNEFPWFGRPEIDFEEPADFRFVISHSPDQLRWARKHNVHLMLAGHTHGGQGRLPLIGPLLSPSYHGSRFASGEFYKSPTTMHVSRGLSGTHLVRIRCRPELSLLVLRAA